MRLRSDWISKQLSAVGRDERVGVSLVDKSKNYVVDFSSPNVAKPMHVGHIRSTVIGDAIVRILKLAGHRVVSDNHLGDWGTQFGMVIYGYKHFRNNDAYQSAPVEELGRLYRVVRGIMDYQAAKRNLSKVQQEVTNQQSKLAEAKTAVAANPSDKKLKKEVTTLEQAVKNAREKLSDTNELIANFESDSASVKNSDAHPNIEQSVLLETSNLHAGDKTNKALWDQFLPHCLVEIHRIYDRLGIEFDHELGESFYHDMLPGVVEDLVNRGLAVDSDGAVCVFLDDYDAPMIIRKKDGAFLYATSDVATVHYRMEHFHPDAILYVVDHRQGEHFAKLFATLRKIGLSDVELNHVAFGTVLGPDGKPFKTRSGSVVGLDYLLDEAIERAWKVVCDPERLRAANLEMSDDEKRNIANAVGIGAIKYADLVHNRTSDYVFDIDKMVRLEGNTATYIQYSFARTNGILRKSELEISPAWFASVNIRIEHPMERALALQILRFDECVHQSLEGYYPSVIADYLFDLAKLFATFFDQCPVLRAETDELRASRLGMVYVTRGVLQTGLKLLGIDVVDRM
jgi:arginyl-tRNA synthetase